MTLYIEDFENGQRCPLSEPENECEQCTGVLLLSVGDDCSCHINPPCPSCTEAPLVCTVCGWEAEDVDDGWRPPAIADRSPEGGDAAGGSIACDESAGAQPIAMKSQDKSS